MLNPLSGTNRNGLIESRLPDLGGFPPAPDCGVEGYVDHV